MGDCSCQSHLCHHAGTRRNSFKEQKESILGLTTNSEEAHHLFAQSVFCPVFQNSIFVESHSSLVQLLSSVTLIVAAWFVLLWLVSVERSLCRNWKFLVCFNDLKRNHQWALQLLAETPFWLQWKCNKMSVWVKQQDLSFEPKEPKAESTSCKERMRCYCECFLVNDAAIQVVHETEMAHCGLFWTKASNIFTQEWNDNGLPLMKRNASVENEKFCLANIAK